MVVLQDLMIHELAELVQYKKVCWTRRIFVIVAQDVIVDFEVGVRCCSACIWNFEYMYKMQSSEYSVVDSWAMHP